MTWRAAGRRPPRPKLGHPISCRTSKPPVPSSALGGGRAPSRPQILGGQSRLRLPQIKLFLVATSRLFLLEERLERSRRLAQGLVVGVGRLGKPLSPAKGGIAEGVLVRLGSLPERQ